MVPDQARSFERWARWRWIASKGIIAVITALLAVIGWLALSSALVAGVLDAIVRDLSPLVVLYLFLGYVVFFVLPVALSLPLLVPLAFAWRQPRRVVVFRRFNRGDAGSGLEGLMTGHFARFGHVFTLADASIRVPWTVRIPVLLGQLALINFRPRTVDTDRRLREFKRLLGRPRWLNINWFVAPHKIFAVRASDAYWQRCVDALLEYADLVVVDVSVPRDTLLWEITNCVGRGLATRMILLASRTSEVECRDWLAGIAAKQPEIDSVPIWWYDSRGAAEPTTLRANVVQRLVAPMRPAPSPPVVSTLARVAASLAWSSALATAAVVAGAPYFLSELTARHSPWRWQVYQAYVYGEASSTALERMQQEFPAQARSQLLAYARSESSRPRQRGLQGLAAIGDRQTIKLLVELANAGEPWAGQAEAAQSLRDLVKRLGPTAAAPDYLDCMRTLPAMAFDREVYGQFETAYLGMPAESFAHLLDAPSEAARFTAAFRLGAQGGLRVVPALLAALAKRERAMFGTGSPLEPLARPHLDRMLEGTATGDLDTGALDLHLAERDLATSYAVKLALVYSAPDVLRERLKGTAASTVVLVELAQLVGLATEYAERAAPILSVADGAWLAALLEDANKDLRLDASLALAIRGDARGLASTLDLMRERRDCAWLERDPCFRYERQGRAVLFHLASTLAPRGRLGIRPEHLGEIPLAALIDLLRVVARAQDDAALKAIIAVYARRPEADVVAATGLRFGATVSERVAEALPRRLTPWLLNQATRETDPKAKAALGILAIAVVDKECHEDFEWPDVPRCLERRLPG